MIQYHLGAYSQPIGDHIHILGDLVNVSAVIACLILQNKYFAAQTVQSFSHLALLPKLLLTSAIAKEIFKALKPRTFGFLIFKTHFCNFKVTKGFILKFQL